jgi:hypothetical protein
LSSCILIFFKGTVTQDLDRLKALLLDRYIVGEEPLVVFKIFQRSFDFKKMLSATRPFRENGDKLPGLANSCWEMLLKIIEQLLGAAKRV